jgi:predicted peroxiredoxin
MAMAKLFFTITKGTNDPVMATLPLELAAAFADQGHDVKIALLSEAVVLMRDEVIEEMNAHGCSPLKEVMADVIKHKIPIYV